MLTLFVCLLVSASFHSWFVLRNIQTEKIALIKYDYSLATCSIIAFIMFSC